MLSINTGPQSAEQWANLIEAQDTIQMECVSQMSIPGLFDPEDDFGMYGMDLDLDLNQDPFWNILVDDPTSPPGGEDIGRS